MRAWIAFLVLAVVLGGCSFAEDKDRGERAVARFHEFLAASRYSEIYVDTTENFREAASEAEFVEFMTAVRRKLGDIRETELTAMEVNWESGETSIYLGYDTVFELGKATEQFVWILDGEKARLESYQIDSKELILK